MNKKNKLKFKRMLVLVMALTMILTLAVPNCSFADQVDIKKDELSDINDDIAELQKALEKGKSDANSLKKQITNIENKIYKEQQNINKLTKNINDTKEKINVTMAELADLENQIGTQNADLNSRLRTMYKNGNIGMLSVLLGSKSMSDFLTNVEMAKRIYQSDEALLGEMQKAYETVIDKKEQLSALKESLLNQQETAKNAKASLSTSEEKLAAQKKSIESDNKALEEQIDQLNAEADKLVAEILRLQGNEAYAGGQMSWPSKSSTRITSKFGNRLHPILKVYKLHTGIDIGAAKGTDIIAANSGKVIKSAYNAGGYGYYVMIDHGGGIVTLYAHASKLLVNVGDIVVRGQTIALVGSTGNSTGPHIHFEVRVNGQYVDPLNYVKAGQY